MSKLKCFFCLNDANSVAYYSKDYLLTGRRTIENPTLCCDLCFHSPRIINQINQTRGGDEGVYRFLFTSIGKWTPKQLTYHLSKKGWEVNHLNSKPWQKLIWRIHFVSQPKKESDGNKPDESSNRILGEVQLPDDSCKSP